MAKCFRFTFFMNLYISYLRVITTFSIETVFNSVLWTIHVCVYSLLFLTQSSTSHFWNNDLPKIVAKSKNKNTKFTGESTCGVSKSNNKSKNRPKNPIEIQSNTKICYFFINSFFFVCLFCFGFTYEFCFGQCFFAVAFFSFTSLVIYSIYSSIFIFNIWSGTLFMFFTLKRHDVQMHTEHCAHFIFSTNSK